MDDVLVIAKNVHLGCYWNGSKITWDEQIMERHIRDEMNRSKLTLDILKQIANSVCDFLEFTGEASIGDQPIPCLDSQLWVGQPTKNGPWYTGDEAPGDNGDMGTSKVEYTVLYKFYKKPMAAILTTLARSAAPESSKVSTATAEVIRRWKNTSTLLSKEEFERITLDYSDDLSAMGFSTKWKRNVFMSALCGYTKICRSETRNRPGASSRMKRRRKKLVGDSDWFSKTQNGRQKEHKEHPGVHRKHKQMNKDEQVIKNKSVVESVMFIPHTPGSTLKNELNKMEEALNFTGRVRYCEELGSKISDLLVRTAPWDSHCGRLECLTCRDRPGQCYKQNVVYKVNCLDCKVEGIQTDYFGETARATFDRSADHYRALESADINNPLVEHWKESHPNKEWNFSMTVVRSFRSPLQRQSCEGYLIANYKGDILMNRKGEWGQNLPPKLIIEDQRDSANFDGNRDVNVDKETSTKRSADIEMEHQNSKKRLRMSPDSELSVMSAIPTETETVPNLGARPKKGKVPHSMRPSNTVENNKYKIIKSSPLDVKHGIEYVKSTKNGISCDVHDMSLANIEPTNNSSISNIYLNLNHGNRNNNTLSKSHAKGEQTTNYLISGEGQQKGSSIYKIKQTSSAPGKVINRRQSSIIFHSQQSFMTNYTLTKDKVQVVDIEKCSVQDNNYITSLKDLGVP